MPDLPSALDRSDEILAFVERAGGRPAVFLDYDGTLTPIVERPDLAVLPDATRGVVAALATLCPVTILSGRDRADVERLVGLRGLITAGSHGYDIAGPDGLAFRHERSGEFSAALDRVERALRPLEKRFDGALVERKACSISVHFRLAAESAVRSIEAAVAGAISNEPSLVRTGGKKLFEIRPDAAWDKGRAVEWVVERLGKRPGERDEMAGPFVPIAIGDDVTDEDAFRAVDGMGAGIVVGLSGGRSTLARYALADPEEVAAFLQRLVDRLRDRSRP